MTRKTTQEDDMQLALFDTDRAEFPGEVAMWDVTMTELNPDCMLPVPAVRPVIETNELTDEQYALADAIQAALEADPAKTWTPSTMARKVRTTTGHAGIVLRYLVRHQYAVVDERGAWTHYSSRTR